MNQRFILFRRAGVFYYQDTTTGKQLSLRTKDEAEARTLLMGVLQQCNTALGCGGRSGSDFWEALSPNAATASISGSIVRRSGIPLLGEASLGILIKRHVQFSSLNEIGRPRGGVMSYTGTHNH
jgi:hypothetical protein